MEEMGNGAGCRQPFHDAAHQHSCKDSGGKIKVPKITSSEKYKFREGSAFDPRRRSMHEPQLPYPQKALAFDLGPSIRDTGLKSWKDFKTEGRSSVERSGLQRE